MHIHILGICGTFMGGVAALAREAGHRVTGCDAGVYPPMSDQLRALGIELIEGYGADQLALAPDVFVVGNVVSRARLPDGTPKFPLMEAILDAGAPYTSGPQWLAEHVLQGRHVLAVAGTHGKTTTTSMLAWVLEAAGLSPGFLVGGVPLDFGISARLGAQAAGQERPLFVIEADEYDTAFFDKRSKFVHYRPRTAVLNNLEFDHADIFDDLAAIERQFHHLVRTVPAAPWRTCAGPCRACTTSSTRWPPSQRRNTWAWPPLRQPRRWRASRTSSAAWSCAAPLRASACTTTSPTTPRRCAPRWTGCAAASRRTALAAASWPCSSRAATP
jgi:UDP-N-acetylmuramate:L-alanyl-gamma-D-glutamyl-meso-diaminopimelate ligase